MYLLDTNIWLERLLDQEKSEEVRLFLDSIPSQLIAITDFAFHSVAIVLCKLQRTDVLKSLIQDAFIEGSVSLIHLEPEDIYRVVSVIENHKLDFDDAYQYVAAEKYGIELVSFDSDFDHTDLGRKTPREILNR